MPNFVANLHALVLAELAVANVPSGENWDRIDQAAGCSFISMPRLPWRLVGDSVPTNAKEVVVEGRIAAGAVSAGSTSLLIPVTVTKVEERQ